MNRPSATLANATNARPGEWKIVVFWFMATLNLIGFRVVNHSVRNLLEWQNVNTTQLLQKYNHSFVDYYDNVTEFLSSSGKEEAFTTRPIVAYVVTLTSCDQDLPFLDAAAVLQHSIQLASSKSRFDYQMYAMVPRHVQKHCGHDLHQLNYTVQKVDGGGKAERRLWNEEEWLKLQALTFTQHPVVVHLELDTTLVVKELDDLIQLLLAPPQQQKQPQLRATLESRLLTTPEEDNDTPQAIVTRDSNEIDSAIQQGFWMVRPSQQVYEELIEIAANSTTDSSANGNRVVELLSDHYPTVEWNRCTVNAMADPPRNSGLLLEQEDCSQTPWKDVYTIHYQHCQEPWKCATIKQKHGSKSKLCLQFHNEWHRIRAHCELQVGADNVIELPHAAENITGYKHIRQNYKLHCSSESGYIPMIWE